MAGNVKSNPRTIKAWMCATHFKMKTLAHVATEMALHVLAYNIKRVIAILGVPVVDRGDFGLLIVAGDQD